MTRTDRFRLVSDRVTRWMAQLMPFVLAVGLLPSGLVAQTADLSVTKTGPSQIDANGPATITYLIITTNNGPSTATNMVLRDTLPPTSDFTFISASRGASRAARRLTWPAITLASGQSIVDTVVIQSKASVGTVLTNVAVAVADEADPAPVDNLSQVQTLVVDVTMLGVSVTPDGADTARRLPSNGVVYAYAFTVTNTGAVTTDYDLLASVAGGSFLTVDSITGTGVTRGAVPDSARLTGLAAGAARTVSAWHRVAGVATGSLDSVILESRAVSIPTVRDTGWAYIRVVRPAILTVKSVMPAGVQLPGAELTYSVVVANGGSEQAAGVVIVDSLPADVQFKVGSVASLLPPGVTAVVEYSTDGSGWGYTPSSTACSAPAGFDGCVSHVRWTFQQPLGAVTPDNSATLEFVARIR
jgi:uncharacterized repeat protein (TIGR01451 family)